MASLLIGHTGFIGSNLMVQRPWDVMVNSKGPWGGNRVYDLVVCCAAPGTKWIANQEPEKDKTNLVLLEGLLCRLLAKRFILVSTADVFSQVQHKTEKYEEDDDTFSGCFETTTPHPDCWYGINRLWLEHQVRRHFPHAEIVRLPGVVGPGLKKNAYHDLQREHELEKLNHVSTFQWYDVRNLWNDVANNQHPVLHLCPRPEQIGETVRRDFPHLEKFPFQEDWKTRVCYNLSTNY